MNEKGKLKHRLHVLVFRRGETPEEDVCIAHIVCRAARSNPAVKKLSRRVQALPDFDTVQYVGWAVEEAYWREHGLAGRHGMSGRL